VVRTSWEFQVSAADTATATENKRGPLLGPRYAVMFTIANKPALPPAGSARS